MLSMNNENVEVVKYLSVHEWSVELLIIFVDYNHFSN